MSCWCAWLALFLCVRGCVCAVWLCVRGCVCVAVYACLCVCGCVCVAVRGCVAVWMCCVHGCLYVVVDNVCAWLCALLCVCLVVCVWLCVWLLGCVCAWLFGGVCAWLWLCVRDCAWLCDHSSLDGQADPQATYVGGQQQSPCTTPATEAGAGAQTGHEGQPMLAYKWMQDTSSPHCGRPLRHTILTRHLLTVRD